MEYTVMATMAYTVMTKFCICNVYYLLILFYGEWSEEVSILVAFPYYQFLNTPLSIKRKFFFYIILVICKISFYVFLGILSGLVIQASSEHLAF